MSAIGLLCLCVCVRVCVTACDGCVVGVGSTLTHLAVVLPSGKFMNCGQTCLAPGEFRWMLPCPMLCGSRRSAHNVDAGWWRACCVDYILVHNKVKQELIDNIKKNIVEFYGENPAASGASTPAECHVRFRCSVTGVVTVAHAPACRSRRRC